MIWLCLFISNSSKFQIRHWKFHEVFYWTISSHISICPETVNKFLHPKPDFHLYEAQLFFQGKKSLQLAVTDLSTTKMKFNSLVKSMPWQWPYHFYKHYGYWPLMALATCCSVRLTVAAKPVQSIISWWICYYLIAYLRTDSSLWRCRGSKEIIKIQDIVHTGNILSTDQT